MTTPCGTDFDVIVVGAGASGVGCAALLCQMQMAAERLLVLEKSAIGDSFRRWPAEMGFITPSFPANGFHQTDLNAITPDSSPAFSLGLEHPSGADYADYLANVVTQYRVPVREHEGVTDVFPDDDHFQIQTDRGRTLTCRYLIWAAGEFQTPSVPPIPGVEHGIHNSHLESYASRGDGHQLIIGGFESGVDAAWHLSRGDREVTVLERRTDEDETYDPSCVLSPVSHQRVRTLSEDARVSLLSGRELTAIERESTGYRVYAQTGESWLTPEPPILCTGFTPSLGPVEDLFLYDDEDGPVLNPFDESTLVPNLFLSGPMLTHGDILLCFIYKFRGRFGVIAKAIGAELELDLTPLAHYQQAGMLLEDMSCCEQQTCLC